MKPAESFINQPVRSLQTMLRVLSLRHEALLPVVPDGVFGPQTMQAVSAFQRWAGIPMTGIADQDTWESIVEAYAPARVHIEPAEPIYAVLECNEVITPEQQHHSIYLAQAMLAAISDTHSYFPRPPLSGKLDSDTAESLSVFQQLSDLPETGHLDKLTWKHLVLQFHLNANR